MTVNLNPSLGIVVAVSNQKILEENLLKSAIFTEMDVPVYTVRNAASAADAYNRGLAHFSNKDIIIFVHQDVYLPKSWCQQLNTAVRNLASANISWGVLGVFGKTQNGQSIGRVWDSGLNTELGELFTTPAMVQTLDELLLVVKTEDALSFDEKLPGFHLFATDLCASARSIEKHAYVIHAPVIHNSKRTRSLGGSYAIAYKYLQKKWKEELPLQAVCSSITKWGVQYYRIRFGLAYRRWLKLIPNHKAGYKNPIEIAEKLGYENLIDS